MRNQELTLLRAKYEKLFFKARSKAEYQRIAVKYGMEYELLQQRLKAVDNERIVTDYKAEKSNLTTIK